MTDRTPTKAEAPRSNGVSRQVADIQDALSRLRAPAPTVLPSLAALRRLYARGHQAESLSEAEPAPPRLTIAGETLEALSVESHEHRPGAAPDASPAPNFKVIDLFPRSTITTLDLSAAKSPPADQISTALRATLQAFEQTYALPRHHRRLIVATDAAAGRLRTLAAEIPHLAPLNREIAAEVSLQARAAMPLRLRPILLVGPSGLGKTHALSKIALAAGLPLELCAMTLMPSSFAWFGSHRTWNNAAMGIIARRLIETPIANPIFFVDEFDKAQPASPNDRNPYNPFYPLLERDTAARFTDEYLGFPIDASHISWIFSANDLSVFPQAILDRVEVITVAAPSPQARLEICRAIYREANAYYLNNFDSEPTEAFLDALPAGSFRGVRRAIERAMAHAAESGRTAPRPADLSIHDAKKPRLTLL